MNENFDKLYYGEDGINKIKYKMKPELRKFYYKNERETVYGREEYLKMCISHLREILSKPIPEWDSAEITEERIKIYQKELDEINKEKENKKNNIIKTINPPEIIKNKSIFNIFK